MEENTQTVITENVDKAKALFDCAYANATKFYTKGTASAAARARKSLSELAKLAKVVRKDLQDAKKTKIADRKASKSA
tara:strand:+ start:561 stop:794 length:234 start_codon:yes stop_codon:yes gene_type:complete